MTSKEIILNNIKQNQNIQQIPLPEIPNINEIYENIFEQFANTIENAGGKALQSDINKLNNLILELYPKATKIASNIKIPNLKTIDPNIYTNPHDLQNLELAIVKGEFAVAQNGAVWIQNNQNKHRALYFIAENLIIIVDKNNLVNNLYEAYKQIDITNSSYGVFISGPSKTADIEQSLVIGAHGSKSLYVIFV